MRIPPPPSLRIDRDALLADVQARLAARLPGGRPPDADDPSWMLIEQAAWIAEELSLRLDEYPLAALQQVAHLLGMHRGPAAPALGVLVVEPREPGVLGALPGRPAAWRFFAPQTEARDQIELVAAEPAAPVRPARVRGLTRWTGAELEQLSAPGPEDGAARALVSRADAAVPAPCFAGESVVFRLVAADAEGLRAALQAAAAAVGERRLGWLRLAVDLVGPQELRVTAVVDPSVAWERSAPTGVAPGGPLVLDWAALEDSSWTPALRYSAHPALPGRLRRTRPMPGLDEGTLLAPELPRGLPLAAAFELPAAPLPEAVVAALWRAIARQDTRLVGLRPLVERHLPAAAAAGLEWVEETLRAGVFADVVAPAGRVVGLVAFDAPAAGGTARVLVRRPAGSGPEAPVVRALGEAGVERSARAARRTWAIELPADAGTWSRLEAWDLAVEGRVRGLLVGLPADALALGTNALLAWNAPVVADGREVEIERSVPTPVSLLHTDIVSRPVVEAVADAAGDPGLAACLGAVALARAEVRPGPLALSDWAGMDLDPAAGELTLLAPDEAGQVAELRPGQRLTLHWYRRCDGAAGNVEAGAVQFAEHAPSTRPGLVSVLNPLGFAGGADVESEAACRDRLLSPGVTLPVTPGDWELLFRRALSAVLPGAFVRVWTWAERAVFASALWPFDDEPAEKRALAAALAAAGPEVLAVAVGLPDDAVSDAAFAAASRALVAAHQRVRRRSRVVRGLVVMRFHPLVLARPDGDALVLPSFDTLDWAGGRVADTTGRAAAPPADLTVLNAAVVRVLDGSR